MLAGGFLLSFSRVCMGRGWMLDAILTAFQRRPRTPRYIPLGRDDAHRGVSRCQAFEPYPLEGHTDREIELRVGKTSDLLRRRVVGLGTHPGVQHRRHAYMRAAYALREIFLRRN